MIIDRRFNGPATSANGGISAGLLAERLPAGSTVQVTLRRPPPLDTDLRVDVDVADARMFDGADLVADARLADPIDEPVAFVDVDTAREAERHFDGLHEHPFPTCFVCGTDRSDGLRVHPGPVDGRVASTVTAAGPVFAWAAMDCPSGWAIGLPGRPAVLGRMTAHVQRVPEPGELCVVVGRLDGWDGRKASSRSTLYTADGTECARSASVWIELPR